jgi:3-hydroxyisobutyrate dehydrogenase-like beta-hydroxyacid dehydrogenase
MRVGVIGRDGGRLAQAIRAGSIDGLTLLDEGANAGAAAVAAASDVVVTAYAGESEAREGLLGRQGVIQGAHAGLAILDLSKVGPDLWDEVATGLQAVGVQAAGAALSIDGSCLYVDDAGADHTVLGPIAHSLANNLRRTGRPGSSKTMSIIERLIACIAATATAEAIALGSRFGLPRDVLVPLLLKGSAGNNALRALTDGHVQPSPAVREAAIDLNLALSLGRRHQHTALFGALARAACRATEGERMDEGVFESALRWFTRGRRTGLGVAA